MVDFSRNPNTFALNKYLSITRVDKRTGYYLKHVPDEGARSLTESGEENLWVDGSEFLDNATEKEFSFEAYACTRYGYGFSLGDLAVSQAQWNILANYAATAASKAMTARTRKALKVLTTTANWGTGYYDTATNVAGGKADVGTTTTPYLKKLVQAVGQRVHKATNGVVGLKDLIMVLNPTDASLIAESQEVHTYLKESPFALSVLQGDENFSAWGLPKTFYGLKGVVIEDTVYVSSKKGAARTSGYALASGNILFMAQPNGLVTTDGTFSTASMFMAEEMTVETMVDVNNRRTIGRVVEDYDVKLVSPISGFLVTSATG